jgi:CelD/BcsL family acetyltransferase involved in cellulose biosynthesis
VSGGLRVEVVTDGAALEGLAAEWDVLFRAVDAAPFQSPAWLIPWWDVFSPGEPFVVTVRGDGGRLVGLAPLYVEEGRRLRPIGLALSDVLDVLLLPELAGPAGAAMTAFALERAPGPWWLDELPPGAAGLTLQARPEDHDHVEVASPRVVVPLGQSLSDTVPARQRAHLRLARNRAARRGLSAREADADTLPELLEALFRLHGARWGARGEPGVLADARVQRFHHLAARRLLRAGVLRLRAVLVEGHIAGVHYGFHHRDRAYSYLHAFDPTFSFESPGTIVCGDAIEAAVREGARELDFLRGREAYKRAWGGRTRWNLRRVLERG